MSQAGIARISSTPPSGGGDWTLIETQTVNGSVSEVDFTTGIDNTYSTYCLIFSNAVTSQAGGSVLYLTMSTDAGATFLTSNYQAGIITNAYNSTTTFNVTSTSYMPLTGGIDIDADYGASGQIFIYGTQTANVKMITGQFMSRNANTGYMGYIGGWQTTSSVVNGFRLAFTGAFTTEGTFSLYGIT